MTPKWGGPADQPRYLVEEAADAGITAIVEFLAHHDAKIENLMILIAVDSVPEGQPDSTVAGTNVDDPKHLLAELVGAAAAIGNEIGIKVGVVPVIGPRPQG